MAAITRNAPMPTPAPTASAVLLFCGAGDELSVDSCCVGRDESADELVAEVEKAEDVAELSPSDLMELVKDVNKVKDVARVSLGVAVVEVVGAVEVVEVEEVELEELSSSWIQN